MQFNLTCHHGAAQFKPMNESAKWSRQSRIECLYLHTTLQTAALTNASSTVVLCERDKAARATRSENAADLCDIHIMARMQCGVILVSIKDMICGSQRLLPNRQLKTDVGAC